MTLLDDLRQAEKVSTIGSVCPLCVYIQGTEDDATREALASASAGSIGRDKLATILRGHNTGIGKRTIIRHREEGHQP